MGIDIETPFIRMPYNEAMNRFGSDKPDTRFGLEFIDISDEVKNCGFKVFSGAVENGGSSSLYKCKRSWEQVTRKKLEHSLNMLRHIRLKECLGLLLKMILCVHK